MTTLDQHRFDVAPSVEELLTTGAAERLGPVDFHQRPAPATAGRMREVRRPEPAPVAATGGNDPTGSDGPPRSAALPTVWPIARHETTSDPREAEPVTDAVPRPPATEPREVSHLASVPSPERPPHVALPEVERHAHDSLLRVRTMLGAALEHLAVEEAGSARRCEALLARAELDAELIRLEARREAHQILSDAHGRADQASPYDEDLRTELHQLTDTLALLSESLEHVLAPAATAPDHSLVP